MDDPVTQWISGLAKGDQTAVQQIWEQYFARLVRLARRKLGDASRRTADEEDVALSAFYSFCRGAAGGRFPQLDDRYDLWKLLVTITARKAAAQMRRQRAHKRGGGAVRGESAFRRAADTEPGCGIDNVLGLDPTPEFAAQVSEQCSRLLDLLEDASLQKIALGKLENYTNEEIAGQLDCSVRTVKRRLAQIRQIWHEQVE